MIVSVHDLAGELAHAFSRAVPSDEAKVNEPTLLADITPPVAHFEVQTVEGKRFTVRVMESWERPRPIVSRG